MFRGVLHLSLNNLKKTRCCFFVQTSMRIRPIQQRFGNKIYLIHEEKVTSLAANCAAGCLNNQLHIELCLLEHLREFSSAWYDYSRRTSDLEHTGNSAAWNEENDSRQRCHHQTWHPRIRFTFPGNEKPFPGSFLAKPFLRVFLGCIIQKHARNEMNMFYCSRKSECEIK